MNESKNKKPDQTSENLFNRPREFKSFIDNKTQLVCFILLGICITFFIFSRNYILSFIVLLLLIIPYSILFIIPLVWTFIKVTFRTKSYDFALQLFVYLQTIPITIISIVIFYALLTNELFFWADLSLYLAILLNIHIFIFAFGWRKLKKPIFWNDEMNKFSAPLISRQSIHIIEELDGYSQRSISLKYDSLEDLIQSPFDFKTKLENYCIFLGKKGELIDWHVEESFAILYPRFLVRTPNIIKKPFFFFRFLRKLYTKRDITSLDISCSPSQISINMAFQDYYHLNREPTFHTLCLNVLESVKQSLTAFLKNNYEEAYNELIDGKFKILDPSFDIEE